MVSIDLILLFYYLFIILLYATIFYADIPVFVNVYQKPDVYVWQHWRRLLLGTQGVDLGEGGSLLGSIHSEHQW